MEKNLSLNYEEAAALLEMCLFTYLDKESEASDSAIKKLGEVCRQLLTDGSQKVDRQPVSKGLTCMCNY